jgi:general secretion pathway protein D
MRNLRVVKNVVVTAIAGLMVFALGQGPVPGSKRFDIRLQDAELEYAIQMLALQAGADLQFVFKPALEPYQRIPLLNLTNVTVEEALKYICDAAGAEFTRDPSGVYIIGPKRAPAPPSEVTPPAVNEPTFVHKITLKHQHPRYILEMLYGQIADQYGEWKALMAFQQMNVAHLIGKAPNAPVMMRTETSFNSLEELTRQATSGDRNEPLNYAGGAGITVPGAGGQGGIAPPTQRGGGYGGGGFGGGGFPGFGGGGQIGPGGGLFGGAGGQINLQGGQGFVPSGIQQIIYDPTDNSFIVRGTDSAVQELENIIRTFDIPPKQVFIKVEFITTSSSLARTFGIDWLFQRGAIFIGNTPGTQARAGDPFFVNFATGNLTTRLRTLLLEGWGTVVNAPFARTLNNQPVLFFTNIQTWIQLNQVIAAGQGQVIVAPQLFPINVPSGLSVQPRINNDGTITMTLQPTISEFGEIRRFADGTEVPDILSQTAFVTVRVKDGESIVIGGLNRKQERFTVQRFPILSDLPIIGNLFRSTARDDLSTELLVFVTAKIVEPDETGLGSP